MTATTPSPELDRLSFLLQEVAALETQAIALERRILAHRVRIADWYTAHPVVAIAAWENKPRDPVWQTAVLGE